MTPAIDECFSKDYFQARERFRAAAEAVGAELDTYALPVEPALSCDVAALGDPSAKKGVLFVSGTHGQEGFAGSAALIALLKSELDLKADVRLVLVHAVNPYGFAHYTRTTENNVDLNRNFIDHSNPPKTDPLYKEIMAVVCSDRIDPAELMAKSNALAEKYGNDRVMNVSTTGQYDYETSLNYGGREREWSNKTVEAIVKKHFSEARSIGVIDWHTGLGERGRPYFVCPDKPGSDSYRRTAAWWGEDRLKNQKSEENADQTQSFDGRLFAEADFNGLLFFGVRQFAPDAEVMGGFIEFGTVPIMETHLAVVIDRYLKFVAKPDDPQTEALRRQMMETLNPSTPEWRASIIKHALEIQHSALQRTAAW